MINLIPNEEKKRMARYFYYRLITLVLVLLSLGFVLCAFATLPSYVLISLKERLVAQNLETQKNKPIPTSSQEALAQVKDLNFKLDLLEKSQTSKFSVSQKIINEIILDKMPDVKITQISYENTAPGGKKVSVRGTAPSRDRLLLFRQALENNVAFKKVDLPISNFVKGSNIQFSFNLTPS